jgi:hypothetical protein
MNVVNGRVRLAAGAGGERGGGGGGGGGGVAEDVEMGELRFFVLFRLLE